MYIFFGSRRGAEAQRKKYREQSYVEEENTYLLAFFNKSNVDYAISQ